MKKTVLAVLLIVTLTTGHGYAMMNCGMMGDHGSHGDRSGGDAPREERKGQAAGAHSEHAGHNETSQGHRMSDGLTPENAQVDRDYQEEGSPDSKAHTH